MPCLLEDAQNELSFSAREVFAELYGELVGLDNRIKLMNKRVDQISQSNMVCQRLMSAPGIGPLVSTAVYAVMGDPRAYKNGREFAAFLGLVPRQYSTGGKTILKGISKRGDTHTRTLLIQGAQAALLRMGQREDRLSRWAIRLKERKGHNVATVALANKLARICWSMALHDTSYQRQGIH
jgi:transposase